MLLAKALIQEFGAKVNIQDFQNNTALHYAVQAKNRKLVRIILEAKPDINLTNFDGFTPL